MGRLASDHQTVTTRDAPDAAAGPDVDIPDATRLQHRAATQVILEVGVATVDDEIVWLEYSPPARRLSARWPHRPAPSSRPPRGGAKACTRSASERPPVAPFFTRLSTFAGFRSLHHTLMVPVEKAAHHVRTHPPQPHHAKLHQRHLVRSVGSCGLLHRVSNPVQSFQKVTDHMHSEYAPSTSREHLKVTTRLCRLDHTKAVAPARYRQIGGCRGM